MTVERQKCGNKRENHQKTCPALLADSSVNTSQAVLPAHHGDPLSDTARRSESTRGSLEMSVRDHFY